MASFTCITCHVAFASLELHRSHYKSDWHRYNLKRKIAQLPPITNEVFQVKASLVKENAQEANEESYCEVCSKYFSSKNAFENHLNSKKHRQSVSNEKDAAKETPSKKPTQSGFRKIKSEEILTVPSSDDLNETSSIEDDDNDSDWESCDDDDDTSFEINMCIFCSHESDDLETNIQHMTGFHSFFVPDIEYVTDLPGLVAYLYGKVNVGCFCTWCRKEFNSAKSAQQHMVDMGHCKILHEGKYLLEYARFYDYTTSYPSGMTSAENDNEVTTNEIDNEGWELTLPSGAKVGHRSLALYYRQNLRPAKQQNSKRLIHRVMSHYRAVGWTGTMSEVALQKAKHITYMRKLQAKQSLKLGVRGNKLQHHFRPQVLF